MSSPPSSGKGPGSVAAPEIPRVPHVEDRGTARHDAVRAERWECDGTVKVTRAVDAGTARTQGAVSIGGNATFGVLEARGLLEIDGPVEVRGAFTLRGNGHFENAVRAGDLSLEGSGRFRAPLTVDRTLTARGALEAPSIRAGVAHLSGSAEVPGDLEALEVVADLTRPSKLGTVRARKVRLKGRVPNLVDKAFYREVRSSVLRVEGERVELEAIDVRFVRGPEIRLGRDCHVTEVEGTIVERHPSSSVGPESKSHLPYGLRR